MSQTSVPNFPLRRFSTTSSFDCQRVIPIYLQGSETPSYDDNKSPSSAFSLNCSGRKYHCPYDDSPVPENKAGSPAEPDPVGSGVAAGTGVDVELVLQDIQQLSPFGSWRGDGSDMTNVEWMHLPNPEEVPSVRVPKWAVVRGTGFDLDGGNRPLSLFSGGVCTPNEAFAPPPQGDFNAEVFSNWSEAEFNGMDTINFLGSSMPAANTVTAEASCLALQGDPRQVAPVQELYSLEGCRGEVPLPSLHQNLPAYEVLTPPSSHLGYLDWLEGFHGFSQTPATGRISVFDVTTPSLVATSSSATSFGGRASVPQHGKTFNGTDTLP